MTIGEWRPEDPDRQTTIDSEQLATLIAVSNRGELTQLAQHLDSGQQQWLAFAMRASRDRWIEATGNLNDADLIHLIKALTIAEMCIPGCTVAEKSPVIYLNRLLKQRGSRLSRDDLLWIKQHSSNRFIPNGPAL